MITTIISLPTDVLVIIFEWLGIPTLAALSQTCKYIRFAVDQFGWTSHLLANPRFSPSTSRALSSRPSIDQVKYHYLPALAISDSRLVVTSRNFFDSYTFHTPQTSTQSPQVRKEASLELGEGGTTTDVITSITPAYDEDGTEFFIGLSSGIIARVAIGIGRSGTRYPPTSIEAIHSGDSVLALSSRRNVLLGVSQNGISTVCNAGSVETLDLKTRAWTCHLSVNHAAFGLTSRAPLVVHAIRPSGISTQPIHILGSTSQDTHPKSAVFGLCGAPPCATWGSDQVIVSGWYNGNVNIHDLRASIGPRDLSSPSSTPHRLPVLTFVDPSIDPIYCVATGGGSSNYIAAGLARHGMVAFWDIRGRRSTGWSVYAPGNDSSPVYSVILESSRLFGVTQGRPFVYDFGHGVTEDTFPSFRLNRTEASTLKKQTDGPGYYVTIWRHSQLA